MRARDTILPLPLIAITLLAAAQEQGPPAEAQVAEAKAIDLATAAEILSDQDLSPLLWSQGGLFADRDPADELLHRRGWNTKQFRNDDGSVTAIIAKGSMHYQDASGHWREIRTDIRPNETGLMEQFAYAVTENRHQVYFSNTVDGGYIIHLPEGDIVLGTQSELRIESAAGDVVFSIPRFPSDGVAADNRMTYAGTYPLVSGYDELLVHKRGVKHDLVLEHRPLLLDAFGDAKHLVLREFVGLPAGWSVVSVGEANLAMTESMSNGVMLVIDENGSPVAMFPTPVIREQDMREDFHVESAKGPYTEYRVEKVSGSYRLEAAPGGVYVETLVPISWLLDSDRQYPVLIDPTIDVEPDNAWPWTGYSVSSSTCYCGQDACGDLVKWRGNDAYKGWMYFNTSSIPDGSNITDTDLFFYVDEVNFPFYYVRQIDVFSGNCATLWSEMTSGTIYVDSIDNFGTGWRDHDLGSSADTDMEQLLPNDFFGLGFDDYDSSDTWYCHAIGWDPPLFWQDPYITVNYSEPPQDHCYSGCGSNYDYGPFTPGSNYSTHSASFEAGGCRWYRFNLTADYTYTFTVCEGGGGYSDDTVFRLYNSACNEVEYDDDTCGLGSHIEYTAPSTGSYYLRVGNYGDNDPESYTLAYRGEVTVGSIQATLQNVGGTDPPAGGTPRLVFYYPNWAIACDISGQNPATCSDLPPAPDYKAEGYFTGTFFGEEFWADDASVPVYPDQTTSIILLRKYPYAWEVHVFDNDTNEEIGPGDPIALGTEVRADVTVINDVNSNLLESQVHFIFDTAGGSYEYDQESAFQGFSGPGDANLYPFFFTPDETGSYDFALEVITLLENGNTPRTDSWTWTQTFIVEEPPCDLDLTLDGASVSPPLAYAGQTVELSYTITNPNGCPVDVCLGASIHLGGEVFTPPVTDWIHSQVCDRVETIPAETQLKVTRCFQIPSSAYAGPYSVLYSIRPAPGGACDFNQPVYGEEYNHNDLHVRRATFGTTVITHGYTGDKGTWVQGMAEAIYARGGNAGTVLRYDPGDGHWMTVTGSENPNEEIILIFNWSQESDGCNIYGTIGTAEAAADALYAALRDPLLPGSLVGTNLFASGVHFIGHSRGTVVNSEVIQRLGRENTPIEVTQVTTLDPHPIPGCRIVECGYQCFYDPQPMTWTNVGWADNYYQDQNTAVPGQTIAGAYNHENLDVFPGGITHSDVHRWYYGTIDLSYNPPFLDTREDWYGSDLGWDLAYFWSDIVGGTCTDCNPSGRPSDPTEEDVASLYNGDFQLGSYELAGWAYHGGDGDAAGGVLFDDSGNIYLGLAPGGGGDSFTHNRFWLGSGVSTLLLRLRADHLLPESNDRFIVQLIRASDGVPVELVNTTLADTSGEWIDFGIPIGQSLREKAYTVRFEINTVDEPDLLVFIDDVELAECTPPSAPTNAIGDPSTICEGGSSTLSASVPSGQTVEWFTGSCGGTPVPGGPSPIVSPLVTTTYYARARDDSTGCVSTTCASVTVEVVPDPSVTICCDQTVCDGGSATLDATVYGGTGSFSYQWEESTSGCNGPWTPIDGATDPTYDTGPLSSDRWYQCGVTSDDAALGCDAISNCVTITVLEPFLPGPISGGGGSVDCGGNPGPMTANPSGGTGQYSYQWYYKDGTSCPASGGAIPIDNATGQEYDPPSGLQTTRTYQCQVNPSGSPDCGGPQWSTNCVTVYVDPTLCPADIDCSGDVGRDDLNILLESWGSCPDCDNCPADISGDCVVGVLDLLILLGDWGPCGQPYMAGGRRGASRPHSTLSTSTTVQRNGRSVTMSGSSAMQPGGNTPPAETVRAPSPDDSVPASGHEEKQRDDGEAIEQNEREGELAPIDSDRPRLFVNYDILEPVTFGGLIEVDRDYVQTGTGELSVELGGLLPVDDHDLVVVYGTAVLEGILSVWLADGFEPQLGDWFVIIAAESVVGEFSLVDLPQLSESLSWDVIYGPATVTVVVTAVPQTTLGDLAVGMTDVAGLRDESDGTEQLAADLNGDGVIDLSDVAILLDGWALLESLANLNADGIVDSAALAILLGELEAMPLSNSELLTAIDLLADLAGATKFVSELREQEGGIDGNGVVGQTNRKTRLDDKPVSHSSSPAGVIDGDAVDPRSARSRRSGSTGSSPLGGQGGQQAESDGVSASGAQTATLRPSGLTLNQALALMGFSGVAEFVAWSSSAPSDQVYAAGQVLLALLTGGTSGPDMSGSPQ